MQVYSINRLRGADSIWSGVTMLTRYKSKVGVWTTSVMIVCFVMALSAVGNAQDKPIDLTELSLEELMEIEVVYAASKHEQKISEAPSSVTIVTAEDIRLFGYRTLAEILQSVRGFYTTYDRNYHYVGVRGFSRPGDYNSRILLLINGIRVNDDIYDQAPIGTDFPIDVDLIDRVEIVRGPSSSLYGTNAFFGAVNVITKEGLDINGVTVSGDVASFDTYKGTISYGNQFQNGLDVILTGSYYDSKGQDLYFKEYDDPSTNDGYAEGCDYDNYQNYFFRTSYRGFTLLGGYSFREKGIPTGAWSTVLNDPGNKTIDERRYLDLEYVHSFNNELMVSARIQYDRYQYDGDYVWDNAEPGDPPDLSVNKDYSRGEWWGSEVRLNKRLIEAHNVTVGLEYRDCFRQDQGNYEENYSYIYLDDRRQSNVWALFAQDEYHIRKDLILNAGVRHDHYQTFGGTTNPRLALIYNPIEKTYLKLLFGEAFRAPNLYELYYNDGMETQKNNPDLGPESISTYEMVVEQYFGTHLRGSIGGYYYEINDLITQQLDPADSLIVFNNVDEVNAFGIGLELEGKWAGGYMGRVSYTYQETRDQMTGKILSNSPKHLGKVALSVPLIEKKIFASVESQYVSMETTVSGNEADPFVLINLTIFSQKILGGLGISGSVYNLFDETYGNPGFEEHLQDVIEQDGRNFRVRVTYEF